MLEARATKVVALLALASLSVPVVAHERGSSDGRFRVLYAEPVVIAGLAPRADGGGMRAQPSRASFDAYGRRFEILLESNSRLIAGLDETARAEAGRVRLLRGTLEGMRDSWVRLTVDGDRQSGMVWDGRDLYVIEPAEDVAPRAVTPLRARGRSPVVFRLSDTMTDPGAAACEAVRLDPSEKTASALEAYKSLVGELRQAAAVTSASGRLQVSTIADYEYFQLATSAQLARNRILAIFNNVDGIFSAQLGIQIELTGSTTVFEDPSDPFTKSEARELLVELGNYRSSRSQLRSTGLTHLLTGRDLNGSTAGIAYIGSLCRSRYGASLSQATSGLASLVAAHEIGHNFGAPHDGEPGDAGEPANPCESTPRVFLMAPQVNGSDQFSQCSLTQMRPEITAARCILPPLVRADLALTASAGSVAASTDRIFALTASVSNRGEVAAESLQLLVTVPGGLTVTGASATGGGLCATQAGGIGCSWTELGPGITSDVTIDLRAEEAGSYAVAAALIAAEDTSSGNDQVTYQVTVAAPTPPPPASNTAGRGGGGLLGGAQLLILLAATVLRLSRRA